MSEFSTPSTWTGWFKKIYSSKVLDKLIPVANVLQKEVKFQAEKKTGDKYQQPIVTSLEQGMTYGGEAATAFALRDAVSGETLNAEVQGSEMVLKGRISRGTMTRSATSEAAFGRGLKKKVENMMASHAKRLEISLIHGRSATGLGVVKAGSSVDTATGTVIITDEQWSPGLWMGMKNAALDFHTAANSTALNVHATKPYISAIDLANKTLTVVFGDATDATNCVVAGKVIYFAGSYSNDCLGLDGILRTTSSTLFGVSVNELWTGQEYDHAGAPDMSKVMDMLDQGWSRGLEGEAALMCSSKFFNRLNINEAALRKYDMSYSKGKAENGQERITFHAHGGSVELLVHRFCKDGYQYLYKKSDLVRIGSHDGITFEDPTNGGEMFHRLEGYNGFEVRSYSDQGLFDEAPATGVAGKGATY